MASILHQHSTNILYILYSLPVIVLLVLAFLNLLSQIIPTMDQCVARFFRSAAQRSRSPCGIQRSNMCLSHIVVTYNGIFKKSCPKLSQVCRSNVKVNVKTNCELAGLASLSSKASFKKKWIRSDIIGRG